MALIPHQSDVLAAIVAETLSRGVCPTLSRVAALCPHIPYGSLPHTLGALEASGYIRRTPYKGGPIRPMRAEDGRLIKISVEFSRPPADDSTEAAA